jgi:enoyl-CoA hydratase/carnithine racemase
MTGTPPPATTLRVTVDGPVGSILLNRPDRLNALSPTALAEVVRAADWLDGEGVHAVVLAGSGRAFCAGFDLSALGEIEDPRAVLDLGRAAADALAGMSALTVAAVHGHCVGGGVVLALACDLRVASSDAQFSIPEVALGIPLAWGGIPLLVREIGPAATRDLVLTCRRVDAAEARTIGLVTRVVDPGQAHAAAAELAADVAARSPLVVRTTLAQVTRSAEDLVAMSDPTHEADLALAALSDPQSADDRRRYLRG